MSSFCYIMFREVENTQNLHHYGLPLVHMDTSYLANKIHCTVVGRLLVSSVFVHLQAQTHNLFLSIDRSIYKLTDFGAARVLEEHDQDRFTSLYGTEEYLVSR